MVSSISFSDSILLNEEFLDEFDELHSYRQQNEMKKGKGDFNDLRTVVEEELAEINSLWESEFTDTAKRVVTKPLGKLQDMHGKKVPVQEADKTKIDIGYLRAEGLPKAGLRKEG